MSKCIHWILRWRTHCRIIGIKRRRRLRSTVHGQRRRLTWLRFNRRLASWHRITWALHGQSIPLGLWSGQAGRILHRPHSTTLLHGWLRDVLHLLLLVLLWSGTTCLAEAPKVSLLRLLGLIRLLVKVSECVGTLWLLCRLNLILRLLALAETALLLRLLIKVSKVLLLLLLRWLLLTEISKLLVGRLLLTNILRSRHQTHFGGLCRLFLVWVLIKVSEVINWLGLLIRLLFILVEV